jgi:hypothetical protein
MKGTKNGVDPAHYDLKSLMRSCNLIRYYFVMLLHDWIGIGLYALSNKLNLPVVPSYDK